MCKKIRVMLVDDEYLAIEDLKLLIDWDKLGFQITSCARSGRQALHNLELYPADLIITDISMPGMDGIRLIEQLKKRKTVPLFLLLTAYAEIDYMKDAFRLGVEDYLIKDEITPEILRQKLLLIREKYIASERLSYSFLQKTLQSYFTDIHAALPAELSCIPHTGLLYCILAPDLLLPWADEPVPLKKPSVSRLISSALPFLEGFEQDGVENLCSFSAYNNKLLVLLHIPKTASTSRVLEVIRRFSQALVRELYTQSGASFSCFYSSSPMELEKLHLDYFSRQKSIRARYFLGPRLAEPLESERLFITNQKLELSVEDLKAACANPEIRLSGFLSELFTKVIKEHNYIGLSHLLNVCFSFFLPEGGIVQKRLETVDFTDIAGICAWIAETAEILEAAQNSSSSCSRETQRALAYIAAHYSEYQLSVQQLADEAGLSVTHFSRIFKQDTGETVWDYLTSFRIQKACEILRDTDARIYEAAGKTGYSSPQYFSQVFYRIVGVKPLDYRKKVRP